MATTQKVGAVLKKTSLPKGGWNASSRISGWGNWHEGWWIESEKNEWYVCRICSGRGNHRLDIEPERRRRCSSSTWRKRSEPTGRVFVNWSSGDRNPQYDAAEAQSEMVSALTDAGLVVEVDEARLVVTSPEEVER